MLCLGLRGLGTQTWLPGSSSSFGQLRLLETGQSIVVPAAGRRGGLTPRGLGYRGALSEWTLPWPCGGAGAPPHKPRAVRLHHSSRGRDLGHTLQPSFPQT